jgi:hypothetical protein
MCSNDRGDKLTYEQLEQANAELLRRVNAMTVALNTKNNYWHAKYKTAKKELRRINEALKRKALAQTPDFGAAPSDESNH